MKTSIFDKTDKGREEIATRCYQLAPRMRSLLVLIDGKQEVEHILKKVAGLGLDQNHLAELLEGGFIQNLTEQNAAAEPAPEPAPEQASNVSSFPDLPPGEIEAANTAELSNNSSDGVLPEGQNQFQAIYHFYNETIKSTIGLRGYGLQLKVERADTIADFRALRQPYLEAVLKAKGNEMARSLRNRLDQLLYLGETPAPQTTIIGAHSQQE
jgi:hypothetical protein